MEIEHKKHKLNKVIFTTALIFGALFNVSFVHAQAVISLPQEAQGVTITAPKDPNTLLQKDTFSNPDSATPKTPEPPRVLIYMTTTSNAIKSLRQHIDSMDIVAPQTYTSTPAGKLLGTPSAEILRIAHDASAKVMPLVVNQAFDQKGVHKFLGDVNAQERLVNSLVLEAKARGYMGFQYDFEHMMASDRDAYTAFVQKSAPLFHDAGLQFSVALAPQHSDNKKDYGAGSWDNWTGAFDYKAIGAVADFVSVMAYDDSKSAGPVASLPWVNEVIQYSLAQMPASKISLGIPFYAWLWRDKTGKLDSSTSYPAIAKLIAQKRYLKKGWSDTYGVSYVKYIDEHLRRYTAWYEDKKSFDKKMALVTANKLFGFSAWALGQEDPSIWNTVVAMKAGNDGLAFVAQ